MTEGGRNLPPIRSPLTGRPRPPPQPCPSLLTPMSAIPLTAVPHSGNDANRPIYSCIIEMNNFHCVNPQERPLLPYFTVRLLGVFAAAGFVVRSNDVDKTQRSSLLMHEKGGITQDQWHQLQRDYGSIVQEFNTRTWSIYSYGQMGTRPSVVIYNNTMEQPTTEDLTVIQNQSMQPTAQSGCCTIQ